MHIRQAVLVSHQLEPNVTALCKVLGIEETYKDPEIINFGLENSVMPIGNTFLEVVSPVHQNTAAGRYLDRRQGDGGYMLILQTNDLEHDRRRVDDLGVRVVWQATFPDMASIHLHPADTGGSLMSLDQPDPSDSWRWAGPHWEKHVRTKTVNRIIGAELQCESPQDLVKRWAQILALEPIEIDNGWSAQLTQGELRFTYIKDERGEGLVAIDIEVQNPNALTTVAHDLGFRVSDCAISMCGIQLQLVTQDGSTAA